MGIIVDTPIQVHVPNVVCTDGSSSSPYEEAKLFDKTIYRMFSRRNAMKTITLPTEVRNEFDQFFMSCHNKANGGVDPLFDVLDEYLGSLGVTNEICGG